MTASAPLSVSVLAPILAFATLFATAAAGALGAWLMHRRTRLSPRNIYLAAALLLPASLGAGLALGAAAGLALVPGLVTALAGSVAGRRLRGLALGAGGALRQHEKERLMLWQAAGRRERSSRARERARGEKTYIASQGELVRERSWPRTSRRSRLRAMGVDASRQTRAGT